jgi:hypothetical protein
MIFPLALVTSVCNRNEVTLPCRTNRSRWIGRNLSERVNP